MLYIAYSLSFIYILAETGGDSFQEMTGLAAVFSACLLSGFAGVFFEKLLKDSAQPSVIVR